MEKIPLNYAVIKCYMSVPPECLKTKRKRVMVLDFLIITRSLPALVCRVAHLHKYQGPKGEILKTIEGVSKVIFTFVHRWCAVYVTTVVSLSRIIGVDELAL